MNDFATEPPKRGSLKDAQHSNQRLTARSVKRDDGSVRTFYRVQEVDDQ